MILEGIVTTVSEEGQINIAPMGPQVTPAMDRLILRPFRTAHTFQNLRVHSEGVFHVTDDVLMLAQAAVGRIEPPPSLLPAKQVRGFVLASACRYYEFRVTSVDESGERARLEADVLHSSRLRDFLGFNRAKHAVVEAAILATRVALLPLSEIRMEFAKLGVLVEKTGGEREKEAFSFLNQYVDQANRHATATQSERS